MKTIFNLFCKLSLTVFLISFNNLVFAQKSQFNEIKIDPRQYVTVRFHKSSTQGKLDTIWNWENRKDVPNQKVRLLDVDGEIKIEFNRTDLIKNPDFEGTVSLEAEISGANGTRKIEVNPYSEVGVQRIPIGIKSEPPFEIAKKLVNMISELRESENHYQNMSYSGFNEQSRKNHETTIGEIKGFIRLLDSIKSQKLTSGILNKALALQAKAMNYNYDYHEFKVAKTIPELEQRVSALETEYRKKFSEDLSEFIDSFKNGYDYDIKKVDIIIQYLSSFENGGEDATKAFLALINKDVIGYKALKDNLIKNQTKLKAIDIDNDDNLEKTLLKNRKLIQETAKALSELSRFEGSKFQNILTGFSSTPYVKSNSTNSKIDQREKDYYFDLIDKHLDSLAIKLSIEAGQMIYKKLIFATIDLGKSGATSGEVLNVYLTWILNSKRDSLSNSPRLPIGKYYLGETGWKPEVLDMFALVKRVHEPSSETNSTLSPSNFKGSGGAVLMLSFHKEDKGITIKQINGSNDYKVTRKNRFINAFEPSFGLNVSYLDFSTEKDVEIGTGLQMGLFRNKIFFGYGVNLHLLSPKDQSPGYFFVGFSFAKLADLFKTSNNVTSQ